jgi:apolipoprotein N-acyltransferase
MFKKTQSILLIILGGVLIFASFPHANMYLFAWIALIPLLLILAKKPNSLFRAFAAGFLTGFISNLGLIYWIYPTIKYNTNSWQLALTCLLLLSAYMSLYMGLWALLIQAVRPTLSVFRFTLFAAALWVTLEYLRSYLFTGFPWVLLGYSQWKFLPVIQIAEYTGVFGVSFLIIWINVGIYRLIITKRWLSFAGLFITFIGILIFGWVRLNLNYYSKPPYITVAVIQGNIDQYKKWDTAYEKEIMQTYSDLVLDAAKHKPDLILWPETAIPGYLPSNAHLYVWINRLAKNTETYHLIGSPYYNSGMDYYNSIILFGPEGDILNWHHKTHLVPFGEYIPHRNWFQPFFGILNTLGDFSRGKELSTLSIKSVIWGTTICSENFFGDISRNLVKNGAEVLTNHTNDAWYFKTSAPYQHFIMNVFRAIENRRPVVVCGNTGVSGTVEPSGKISKTVPIFETTYFLTRIEPCSKITFYTKWNDLFAKACIFTTLLMLVLSLSNRWYKLRKNKKPIP